MRIEVQVYEGSPCKKCGNTLRYKSCRLCIKCAKQRCHETSRQRAEYFKQYKQAPTYKERQKLYQKQYRSILEHKEYQAVYQKQYKPKRKYFWAKKKEYQKEYQLHYRQTPQERARKSVEKQLRRAKLKRIEGYYTVQEWLDLKCQYNNRCLCCGKHESEIIKPLEQDHIIPLCKNGSNWITNIQPLCQDCNGSGGKWKEINDFRKTPHPLCISYGDH